VFDKILIANRGEIALRIIRTLREMGITSVACYSDGDRDARFALEANEAYRIGPAPASESYLNQEAVLGIALQAGCDGIHPGYGFLAENADFAAAIAAAGLTFIGPSPAAIRLMGDKIAARRAAVDSGVPVVPGSDGAVVSLPAAREFTRTHGVPVMVKAGGGGGGRGIRVVESEADLEEALNRASREAEAHFRNPSVYLERYFPSSRHIEIQVTGDRSGNVVAWGERDCSTQRKRQKLIEETPAPGLSDEDRDAMMEAAIRLTRAAKYVGVGTVEFLNAGPRQFFFLEMNTRIQVEHTITEQVTGQDLIRESIELAAGKAALNEIQSRGHAIEVRINAEDPARGFSPGPGTIQVYREPGGVGIRVDSGVYQGFSIPAEYDSLIAKLVVHAPDRNRAIERIRAGLQGYVVQGVPTTIPLLQRIINSETFVGGNVTTDWLDANLEQFAGAPQGEAHAAEAVAAFRSVDVEVNGKRFSVRVHEKTPIKRSAGGNARLRAGSVPSAGVAKHIISPMHGTVLAVKKAEGDDVKVGEAVFVVEAMKMENEVLAPRTARIDRLLVAVGDTVDPDQVMAELTA
jgi:acetyl-CoA/propionyl-CoA carboxylase biotin carboxyl carrier protein